MAWQPPLPPAVVDPLQKAIQSVTGSIPVGAAGQSISGAASAAGAAAKGAVTGVSGLLPGADAAGSLLDVLVATRRWVSVRHNWVRVAWTVTGVALMWAGALMVIKPEISSAVQAVGEVPGAGKAIKAVA
jgi:hypothetical protein